MSKYSSRPITVSQTPAQLFARFGSLSALGGKIEQLPEDIKAKVGDIRFTDDALVLITPQVGEIEFAVKERREPELIVFEARKSPVPLEMAVNFAPNGNDKSDVSAIIDVELPMMLKPFVGPKLQEAADKFGEIIAGLGK